MRPHEQSDRARLRDVQAIMRALGRAIEAGNDELVKTLQTAIRLLSEPQNQSKTKAKKASANGNGKGRSINIAVG